MAPTKEEDAAARGVADPAGVNVVVVDKAKPLPAIADRHSKTMEWKAPGIGQLLFTQVSPLIAIGQVRRLEPEDLCHLPELDSGKLAAEFEKDWAAELKKPQPSLIRACLVGSAPIFIGTGLLYTMAQGSLFTAGTATASFSRHVTKTHRVRRRASPLTLNASPSPSGGAARAIGTKRHV
jgi:hypothetical protein